MLHGIGVGKKERTKEGLVAIIAPDKLKNVVQENMPTKELEYEYKNHTYKRGSMESWQ